MQAQVRVKFRTCNDPSQMVDRQGPKYASIGNCHMVVLLTLVFFMQREKSGPLILGLKKNRAKLKLMQSKFTMTLLRKIFND